MRNYVFTLEATQALESRVEYLYTQHATDAADSLVAHIDRFLSHTVCTFPLMGRHIENKRIWEIWIPHTHTVLWYWFDDETLTVIALWHTAQDRLP